MMIFLTLKTLASGKCSMGGSSWSGRGRIPSTLRHTDRLAECPGCIIQGRDEEVM